MSSSRSLFATFRLVILVVVLILESLVLAVQFQTAADGTTQHWALVLHRHPSWLRLVIATLFATLLFSAKWVQEGLGRTLAQVGIHSGYCRWLFCHLLAFAGLAGVTSLVLNGLAAYSLPGLWPVAWAALLSLTLICWGLAAFPARFWLRVVGRGWPTLLAGFAVGLAAVVAARGADELWRPLGKWTLWIVQRLLALLPAEPVIRPEEMLVGTDRFVIEIAPGCSGYQGIGLIWVFLGVYFWLFRHYLRFPQALLLLPVGTALVWLLNALRIFLLVVIGSWISPQLALGGFHSQAGWLVFNAVALGLVAAAHRMRFFAKVARSRESANASSPAKAYLLPLLVLVATIMVTGAFSEGFDYLYPLRVVAVAATLWFLRREYAGCRWSWSWTPLLIGAVVFVLWLLLEPAPTAANEESEFARALGRLPSGWAGAWLGFRVIGSTIMAPVAEELAFRGYLTRRLIALDVENVPPGSFTWGSFLISSALFGAIHDRWAAGFLAGMLYALALYRRGKLADAVVAHACTNTLLTAYVLATGNWYSWS
jgi:exosortase E/protease (VPEID-CTERM system)